MKKGSIQKSNSVSSPLLGHNKNQNNKYSNLQNIITYPKLHLNEKSSTTSLNNLSRDNTPQNSCNSRSNTLSKQQSKNKLHSA